MEVEMKRVSRITTCTIALLLVLVLMLAWAGGQEAWAGTMTWSSTGQVGHSTVYSLAWNGTSIYAGCYDGHVYSKTGTGSWTDTGATGGSGRISSRACNGTD